MIKPEDVWTASETAGRDSQQAIRESQAQVRQIVGAQR